MYPRQSNSSRLVLTAGVLASVICQAQENSAKPSVDQLLRQLHHAQWTDRAEAYEKLRSDSKALSSRQVHDGLLNLLDSENRLVESVNRDSAGPSVDEKYREEYTEYLGELGQTVDGFANWKDPRQSLHLCPRVL
jgi:hypothetical protein